MKARSRALIPLVAAFCCVHAGAAPVSGVDADREEARINREFERSEFADEYLGKIVDRLVAANPSAGVKIRVRAVQADHPFVFALGNGATYVSTGLLARLQNDSQVAALIAPEITGVLVPNTALENQFTEKNGKHLGAKLLAVIATGGLATFPIISSENKAMSAQADALVLDNDKTAIAWMRRAGFDATQGPAATRRLKELLEAEQQFALSRLASSSGLERRAGQFTQALDAGAQEGAAAPTADAPEPLRAISYRLSMALADAHLNAFRPIAFNAVVDRVEREHGVTGNTSCLRARFARRQATGSEVSDAVVAAYRTCVAAPDAPPEYLRELGFLLRDKGDAKSARQAFEQYLKRAPGAVDAPIVRGYIEELHEKT